MNKKILIGCISVVFMLVAISIVSAANTEKSVEKKESPLFGIRTSRAISEKIQNIKTKFFGERLFFLPFQLARNNNQNLRNRLQEKTAEGGYTCHDTCDSGGGPLTRYECCTHTRIVTECVTCNGPTCGHYCGK